MVKELATTVCGGIKIITGINYTSGNQIVHLNADVLDSIKQEIISVLQKHHVTLECAQAILQIISDDIEHRANQTEL